MILGQFDSFFGSEFGAAKKKVAKKPVKKVAKKVVKKIAPSTGPAVVARRGAGHFNTATTAHAAVAATITSAVSNQPGSSAMQLQADLATLGKVAKDSALIAIKVDGNPGPKTAAAVNRAFTKHVGSGQAAAQYRTGKMPLDYIKNNASVLSGMLQAEIRRRGGTVVPYTTVAGAKAAAKASAKIAAAQRAAQKKALAQQKSAAAKAKILASKTKSAKLRAQAAAAKKSGNTAAAAALTSQANDEDMFATQATQAAVTADTDAQSAAQEESVATQAAMTEAANEVSPSPEAAALHVAAGTAKALIPSGDEADAGAPPAAMAPTTESESGGESFMAKAKWPLIIAGGVGVLGFAAFMLTKKKPGSKALAARA